MIDLSHLTLAEASDLLLRREISSHELAQATLKRIERLDPLLNSYITVTEETALRQARQADAALQAAERGQATLIGPLLGVPIGLKDLYETAGIRTTMGSTFFRENVPQEDAFVVQRLYEGGAVLVGKHNMHEIALGVTNVNPHYGPCRNPWNRARVTGGSSGGSAAALAAGLCLGALGSDTGGSIRIPAALCGVVGLKPTYGRVSVRGVMPLSWNLDHAGPMARRVLDVAILLQMIAGYDVDDPYCADVPADDYLAHLREGVRGWRVGLASDEFFRQCEPDVLAAFQAAARVFEDLGANVEEIELRGARKAALANGLVTPTDASVLHRERLQSQPEGFGADVRLRLQNGAATALTDYILARQAQVILRRQLEWMFEDYDILLTPTTPVTAPRIEGQDAIEQARRLTRFTAPFNLTGLPALSIPCGFDETGLPIGLQIIGPPWAEARVLRAGNAYEQATDWHTRVPPFEANDE